jgi:hypothetical protein
MGNKRIYIYPLIAVLLSCLILFTSCNPDISGKTRKLINNKYQELSGDKYPIFLTFAQQLGDVKNPYDGASYNMKDVYEYGFKCIRDRTDNEMMDCANFLFELVSSIDKESPIFEKGYIFYVITDNHANSFRITNFVTKETAELISRVDISNRYASVEDYTALSELFKDYSYTIYIHCGKAFSKSENEEVAKIANDFENIVFLGYDE